ncbi:MAG: hypothetical protein ACK559_09190, partial [bacterium]
MRRRAARRQAERLAAHPVRRGRGAHGAGRALRALVGGGGRPGARGAPRQKSDAPRLTAAAPSAPRADAPQPDVGALWSAIEQSAGDSPREHAVVESFEPVSFADGTLAVRRARPGGGSGTALQDMLA